ncbi:MAG: hypothetical protein NVSMB1_19500 [Polyangiales bacterium]
MSFSGRLVRRFYDPLLPFSRLLDPVCDPLTIRFAHWAQSHWDGPPLRNALTPARERALAAVAAVYRPRVAALADGVLDRDSRAIEAYEQLAVAAVGELRGTAGARAADEMLDRVAHQADRFLYADRAEWLDDPSFDTELRVRTIDRLDRLNEAIGSYQAFFDIVAPLVSRARSNSVSCPVVVDLASGHGGFAIDIALRLGAREGRARVIATDVVDDFLAVGRARAHRFALGTEALSFFLQDALDLRDLSAKVGAPIDVVCCTQTLHHFSPGFVGRMLAEAVDVARVGVAFIDGERNLFSLLFVALVGSALGRGSIPFFHDSMASIRRMYSEQELTLLAMLVPRRKGAPQLQIARGWTAPGHIWITAQ